MYKDRGTIKWTAMMLPEHVQELKNWRHEPEEKPPSALEEWQLEELDEKLNFAFAGQKNISLFIFEGRWSEEKGIIQQVDAQRKLVWLADELIVRHIPMSLIYRVVFHD